MSAPTNHHIVVVTVENKSGVLARVASLFARRGYNIHSLAVAPTADERFSRITMVVDVETAPVEQMVRQLDKLVNVVKIAELAPAEAVERELLLLTVRVAPDQRHQVVELARIFDAKILNVGHDALTISLEGNPTKLDDLAGLLEPFGITELQRSGRIALPRLSSTAGPVRLQEAS